jgi:predicted protein tyrosine phosphatase
MVAAHSPRWIISLLDPGFNFPDPGLDYLSRHLRLRFHDVHSTAEGYVMPSTQHVDELLTFLRVFDQTDSILIHCRAGIGRSTAAAFIAACLFNPSNDEHEIALGLRIASPHARPNETLIKLADDAMKRNGRMSNAVAITGRDLPPVEVAEGEPFELPSTYQRTAR